MTTQVGVAEADTRLRSDSIQKPPLRLLELLLGDQTFGLQTCQALELTYRVDIGVRRLRFVSVRKEARGRVGWRIRRLTEAVSPTVSVPIALLTRSLRSRIPARIPGLGKGRGRRLGVETGEPCELAQGGSTQRTPRTLQDLPVAGRAGNHLVSQGALPLPGSQSLICANGEEAVLVQVSIQDSYAAKHFRLGSLELLVGQRPGIT
jgi:hypothetical protein